MQSSSPRPIITAIKTIVSHIFGVQVAPRGTLVASHCSRVAVLDPRAAFEVFVIWRSYGERHPNWVQQRALSQSFLC